MFFPLFNLRNFSFKLYLIFAEDLLIPSCILTTSTFQPPFYSIIYHEFFENPFLIKPFLVLGLLHMQSLTYGHTPSFYIKKHYLFFKIWQNITPLKLSLIFQL